MIAYQFGDGMVGKLVGINKNAPVRRMGSSSLKGDDGIH